MKRSILAILLAVVMTCTPAMSAFAAEGDSASGDEVAVEAVSEEDAAEEVPDEAVEDENAVDEAVAAEEDAEAESEDGEVDEGVDDTELTVPTGWEIPVIGMDIAFPQSWIDSKRYFSFKPWSVTDDIKMANIIMYNATVEEIDEAGDNYEGHEEEYSKYVDSIIYDMVMFVIAKDTLSTEDALEDLAEANGFSLDDYGITLEEIGKAEGWKFYLFNMDDSMKRHPEPVEGTKEIVEQIFADLPTMIENITFYTPIPEPKTEEGAQISFKTVDFDGNEVDSAEIFAKNKFTMINVWASYCSYCIEEMPQLEAINAEYADQGCGIIAILSDGDQEDKLEIGKGVAAESGITFPMLVGNDSIREQLIAQSYPTSIFVDSEGKVVAEPIKGAYVEKYTETFDQLLSGNEPAADAESAEAEEAADAEPAGDDAAEDNGYVVLVQDEDGNPVDGAAVLFCSDVSCSVESTGEDGRAVFNVPAGVYTIHMAAVPDGFQKNTDEYQTPEAPGTIVVTLEK